MAETQVQIERLRTLQESYHDLAEKVTVLADNTAKATAIYNSTTGNLTIENVQITIE